MYLSDHNLGFWLVRDLVALLSVRSVPETEIIVKKPSRGITTKALIVSTFLPVPY